MRQRQKTEHFKDCDLQIKYHPGDMSSQIHRILSRWFLAYVRGTYLMEQFWDLDIRLQLFREWYELDKHTFARKQPMGRGLRECVWDFKTGRDRVGFYVSSASTIAFMQTWDDTLCSVIKQVVQNPSWWEEVLIVFMDRPWLASQATYSSQCKNVWWSPRVNWRILQYLILSEEQVVE